MQSKQDRINQLSKIRQKIETKSSCNVEGEIFLLARELGCLADLIGREYRFVYEDNMMVGFRQLPIRISQYKILIDEFQKVKEMEAKQLRRKRKK